jgi:hypothetical protein
MGYPGSRPLAVVTGASSGIGYELAGVEPGSGPVTVTTAVPGLMRTGAHVAALFRGQHDKELTWFGLGATPSSLPPPSSGPAVRPCSPG